MEYKEIIDTIKVGDYVEVKGSAVVDDGIHFVQMTTFDDEEQTLRVNGSWPCNKFIVRKVSQNESVKNIKEQAIEAQDSQNENDSSQSGSEIVVGSKWKAVGFDAFRCGFEEDVVYVVSEPVIKLVYLENSKGVVGAWVVDTFLNNFKPVEQSTDRSTDTLKEQLASEEASDAHDVHGDTNEHDLCLQHLIKSATYSVYVPTRRKQARNKYDREIVKGVFVDVYDVLDAFQVTDPCLQHLIKKALAVGIRGHKDAQEDYTDILDSAKRALEKYEEKSL